MDELITKLKEKAKACGDKTKEDRARKGAYIDCIVELKALRKHAVSGSDRIAYIEEELGRCNWCNRDAKYKTINHGNLCNHCYNKLHKFQ